MSKLITSCYQYLLALIDANYHYSCHQSLLDHQYVSEPIIANSSPPSSGNFREKIKLLPALTYQP